MIPAGLVDRSGSRAGVRLLASHGLAATAMSMPWPALLASVWSATGSDRWLGAAGAARMLPYVVLSAAAGMLADRFRRTALLRWSTLARAVLLLGCAGAMATGRLGVAVLLAMLTVAVGTPAFPAAVSVVPKLVPQAQRSGLTDLLVTAEVTAFVVGPALGGIALGFGVEALTALAAALLAAVAGLLLLGLDSGPAGLGRQPNDPARIRTVLAAPGAAAALSALAVTNFVVSAAGVGLVMLSYESWRSGDRGFGIATAALGFGSLAAPVLGLLVRRRGSLLVAGAGLAGAGLAPGVVFAALPLALAGASATVVECACTEVLQRSVPDRVRAFSLGLADTAMVSAALLGVLVVPSLVGLIGPVTVFVGLAGLLVALGCVRLSEERRIRAAAGRRDESVV